MFRAGARAAAGGADSGRTTGIAASNSDILAATISRAEEIRSMTPAPVKPMIERSLIDQIDVRVGTIETVSSIEGSQRLVRLDPQSPVPNGTRAA